MYKIFPNVKQQVLKDGFFSIGEKLVVFFEGRLVNVFNYLNEFLEIEEQGSKENATLKFLKDEKLGEEAYRVRVEEDGITVFYNKENGAYYGSVTLKQILRQAKDKVRCLEIFDEPDLKIRGFMMDISRDKVPTVETVKQVIDLISEVKMNHFELYVEGFSYGYPSFTQFLKENNYISVEEYQEIERYANSRMVDLVPNQNGFGHMTKWLETEEYKDLAEVPEGIFLWGRQRKASTLNPLDPRSLELVKAMYKDMLPYSNSKYFNMNFDEPFELGKGKSKEAVEKEGLGNVYIDFVLKAYEEVKKYNKTPMIWGDVLINHPELLHRLPEEMLFIDWGYDANYPFNRHLKQLSDLNIKFLAAPATTSWCSFLGRTNDWWENIQNACVYTHVHGGEGVIVTDWGDFGHLQFLPISYAPLVFTGLMSWRVREGTFFTHLPEYLNKVIFKDTKNLMANTIIEFGNYYRYYNDYRSNGTVAFYIFMWATHATTEDDPVNYFLERNKASILSKEQYELLNNFLEARETELDLTNMQVSDAELIKAELKQSSSLVKLINKLSYSFNESLSKQEKISLLEEIINFKEKLISEQKRLWLARNKYSDLDTSIGYLERFILFAEKTLNYIKEVA